jgi:non-specific serine/threonine protein kinase/serine/threonine-protein kinase
MDYVEGLPVNQWCEKHGLGVAQRCELICRICEAVAYAHRSLVIHRDLKPGNILVGEDGNPKLLDFGIAKLLGDGAEPRGEAETRTPLRPFTPEYASPEQAAGGAVGTATDVYSLGVVSFELLTGKRPDNNVEKASAAALRNGRGLRWARHLEGDLDTILQMALRTEPERRYLGVAQFQNDLGLHLRGMPVSARQETALYRWGKFARRHRVGVLAASLVILSLAGGLATTLWQSRRAEAERQRAERRFSQVRELAGKLIFDFHDAVAPLPGSTPVRKMVVETGLRYYDSLLRDAGGNRELLEEIARGYDRLGDVQGNSYYANLGDVAGAEASYVRARAIRDGISDSSPGFLRDRVQGFLRMGEALYGKADYAGSVRSLQQGLSLGNEDDAPRSREMRETLATLWSRLGDSLMGARDPAKAADAFSKALALRNQLAVSVGDDSARRDVGLSYAKLADLYFATGRFAESLENSSAAFGIFRNLTAAKNPDSILLRYICFAAQSAATTEVRAEIPVVGLLDGVAGQLQSCEEAYNTMAASDPNDQTALLDLVFLASDFGDWEIGKHPSVAMSLWQRGIAAATRVDARGVSADDVGATIAGLHRRMAAADIPLGHYAEAQGNLFDAEEHARRVEASVPESAWRPLLLNAIAGVRADLFIAQKSWPDAIRELQAMIAYDETMFARHPYNLTPLNDKAERYALLAQCFVQEGRHSEGVHAMQLALDTWTAIAAQRRMTPADIRKRNEASAWLRMVGG